MLTCLSENPIDIEEAQRFLYDVGLGCVQLLPMSPNPVFGNWEFRASNGWRIVIFMDGGFDYVDSIHGHCGQSLLFDDIYQMDEYGVAEMQLDFPDKITSLSHYHEVCL